MLDRLLDRSWPDQPMWRRLSSVHGPGRDLPAVARTYVAVAGGEAVGAATALVSTVHTPLRMLVVNVCPSRRREGIGSELVAALAGDPAIGGGPILMRTPAGDPSGLGFSARLGLAVINRAFGLEVDPESPAASVWLKGLPTPADLGCHLRRSGESGWPGTAAFVDFLHEGYRRSHETWVPCAGFPPERREGFFLSELEPDSPVALLRQREIVAAASLRRDETFGPELLHLVFAYASPSDPAAVDLVGMVVAECLRFAAARGRKIAWELHETDAAALVHARRLSDRRLIDLMLYGPGPGSEPRPEGATSR
jgi:GNAT superfamily N-acetyltransferase